MDISYKREGGGEGKGNTKRNLKGEGGGNMKWKGNGNHKI